EADHLLTNVHEDAVTELRAIIVPPGGCVPAGKRLADAGEVVEDSRGYGLPIRILAAIQLHDVVANARAARRIDAATLDQQTKLPLPAPPWSDIESLVPDFPDAAFLVFPRPAPGLDAVTDVVHALDGVAVLSTADPPHRQAFELIPGGDALPAIAE